jgi:hypothetical protein
MKKRGGMKGIKESGIESRPAEVEVSGEMDGKGKKRGRSECSRIVLYRRFKRY